MTAYITYDLYADIDSRLENSFTQLSSYARRATNFLIALLMVLLVGSCNASRTTSIMYDAIRTVQELRAALFSDSTDGAPAATDISQARNFVEKMPKSMLFMTRDEISTLFGEPSFHRHDADAEVWQYKTATCVIDFYFYGKKQVSYIDARRKDQTPASASEESSCLHDIGNQA